MALIKLLAAVAVVACVSGVPFSKRTDEVSEVIKSIESYGYPAEAHRVVTEDGYILELHRIPHGKGQSPSGDRPLVFLQHGLVASSNCYTQLGPELALAYILADAGFDVWMGNARGNGESRSHVTLDPDDPIEKFEFFDFSFEEIALIDMPAMIDYTLAYTGKDKMHYVGHSQGGTVFLILCSMKPDFNEKFASVHLLAGVGYQNHFPTSNLRNLALITDTLYNVARLNGMVELFGPSNGEDESGDINMADMCDGTFAALCELVNEESLNGLEPAGAAFKQVAHYGQNIRDRVFRRWNFGIIQNLWEYGAAVPPAYNLGLITADVTMHYSLSDILLGEEDVLAMAAAMPNAKARRVSRDTFLHIDFVVGTDMKEQVSDFIVDDIRAREKME